MLGILYSCPIKRKLRPCSGLGQPSSSSKRDRWAVKDAGHGKHKDTLASPALQEGEHFATHCDGMYANDNDECSIYSVVLYLNEDYEGGELEFTDSGKRFRPTAGTAVLLPHDLPHAGLEVSKGIKYVARSELMFRCVDRRPPPAIPKYADDPLFRRMAALYEQIGDLAAKGDASVTTKAYQEALGLQIAHQGTDAKRRATNPLPFEEKSLEHILGFLHPLEVHILMGCGGGRAEALPEKRACAFDWVVRSGRAFADFDGRTTVRRSMRGAWNNQSGDMLLKVIVLLINYTEADRKSIGESEAVEMQAHMPQGNTSRGGEYTMPDVGKVDFQTVAEAFSWAFRKLGIRATDYQLVAPLLPGLLKQTGRARLAQILTQRFEVPRLSFVDAPLCALRARGLKTGTVI
ncbi:unnamed protein product [Symbiodinium necroappetens]|uniref:Fe2OG dioxygenase domain-containing protein n=1 Tax=Symbiodinium necroappetens TaxID=1628268 RepID=A0A813A1I8_9DINO|nr:unnamed protein product [Symbiodinium necroappetens]